MCKISDVRFYEVEEESDPGWFKTTTYSVAFNGSKGFRDEVSHSEQTGYGPELYDGKQGYKCIECITYFEDFHSARRHPDENPDENPDILRMFGLS